jgi:hypothetical protein
VVAKAPDGTAGLLSDVSAVPHSSDVWVLGNNGGTAEVNTKYYIARRHAGHWQKVKTPSLGGRYGSLYAVAAASARAVWIGGEKQQPHTIQELPAIWRLVGNKFVQSKLPEGIYVGATEVLSMSASSPTNVWAVGAIYPKGGSGQLTLHWNGKKWSVFPVPEGLGSVSTSGPDNAWATASGGSPDLYHWNGKAWSADGTAPSGAGLNSVTTDSPALAYAIGFLTPQSGGTRTVIMRYNGTTWSTAKLGKGTTSVQAFSITMSGRSAWAVGAHYTASGNGLPVILHTTGGTWTTQHPPGGKSFTLNAICAESSKHVYAVGYDHATGQTFFDAYNGHTWKSEPSKF